MALYLAAFRHLQVVINSRVCAGVAGYNPISAYSRQIMSRVARKSSFAQINNFYNFKDMMNKGII